MLYVSSYPERVARGKFLFPGSLCSLGLVSWRAEPEGSSGGAVLFIGAISSSKLSPFQLYYVYIKGLIASWNLAQVRLQKKKNCFGKFPLLRVLCFFFTKTKQRSHGLTAMALGSAEVVIPELYVESHKLSEAVEPLILLQVVRSLLKII